jgi:amino acid adenylation domain-containing protein
VPREVATGLRALGQRQGSTLFMTLLAAFETLLHRYTGQVDLVIGSPFANRDLAEIEPLIGYFVNTLALRTSAAGDPTFAEFLGRVRRTVLDASGHREAPFEKVVGALQPERNLSYAPVVQVMFAYQNTPKGRPQSPGLRCEQVQVGDVETTRFDLTLSLEEVDEGLTGYFEFATDLFDEPTLSRMAGHLSTLLEGIVAEPQARLSRLALMTERERRQLAEWNDTRVHYAKDGAIHHVIERQAAATPDAVAVWFEGQSLTYRELNRRANQLARHLQRLGVQRDSMVGICAERSLELVVGLLGIVKAGGAYLPLDPTYPKDRLTFMMEDARVPVLLTQERLRQTIAADGAHRVCLDSEWSAIERESGEDLGVPIDPEQLAYVIFTSGSTGRPKGAMNTHAGILNRLQWMQAAYGLTGDDRVMQKTHFSFDVSVWEFFWPLMYGARLVVSRPGGHQDSQYLVQLITEQQITTLHFVPSMLEVFLKEKGVESCTSIRRVICSGEALPYETQQRFFARLSAELHNLYGPTEAAVDVTYWACKATERPVVPIGRPIANIQIHLLDPLLQPVPIGIAGELHIGGIGLARGYLNRVELTAEKFITSPAHGRLYKTGDLARYFPDGNIEYLGRIDHQVKIRGFRIELGEIEAVVAQHPEIREVLVMAREDRPGDKRLVAYVVPRKERAPSTADLKAFLKDKLPEHMVPSVFVSLAEMPLSPNGKADRKALPAPDASHFGSEREWVAPRNQAEEVLADLWSRVLQVERVGVHDNFFERGGHSLLAMQLVSRVREAFQVELPLRSLFEKPTISELVLLIEEQIIKQLETSI